MADKEYRGKEIQLCDDGKYRWVYELDMLTNPIILWTVVKILGGVWIGIWLLMVLMGGFDGFLEMLKLFLYILAGIVVLSLIGYLIVVALYRRKYVVLFEMDEESVSHIQLPKQFEKAQVLAWITTLVGIAAKRPSTAGAGILAASKNSSTSLFKDVRSVRLYPGRNLIKVNQALNKNQIYAAKEDLNFVYEYIKSRCPKAK